MEKHKKLFGLDGKEWVYLVTVIVTLSGIAWGTQSAMAKSDRIEGQFIAHQAQQIEINKNIVILLNKIETKADKVSDKVDGLSLDVERLKTITSINEL